MPTTSVSDYTQNADSQFNVSGTLSSLHNSVTNNVTYTLVDENESDVADSVGMSIDTANDKLVVNTSIIID